MQFLNDYFINNWNTTHSVLIQRSPHSHRKRKLIFFTVFIILHPLIYSICFLVGKEKYFKEKSSDYFFYV